VSNEEYLAAGSERMKELDQLIAAEGGQEWQQSGGRGGRARL